MSSNVEQLLTDLTAEVASNLTCIEERLKAGMIRIEIVFRTFLIVVAEVVLSRGVWY
jgi:hypothetical protein